MNSFELNGRRINIGDSLTDDEAMELAIHVGYNGAPYVSPNPLVGCVVLDANYKLITTGYHTKYGFPHAEAEAIKNLNELSLQSKDFEQLQFFVTLEPCAHEGKTPSCAKALAKLKPARVVYGLFDPNPLVAGQGADILRNAGVQVEEYNGQFKPSLEQLAEIFLKNFRQKKIFVSAKVAQSIDGQIALASGESKWITSEHSREYVHELRSYYDAVLVGSNTILTDDPSLNIRHSKIIKENKVVCLDFSAKVTESILQRKKYKFIDCHHYENIFICISKEKMNEIQLKIQSILNTKSLEDQIDLIFINKFNFIYFENNNDLLNQLFEQKIKSIFIEGGAYTYSSFLKDRLIDRLYIFMAPVIIGSQNGLSWTQNVKIEKLSEKYVLEKTQFKFFGSDIFLTGILK